MKANRIVLPALPMVLLPLLLLPVLLLAACQAVPPPAPPTALPSPPPPAPRAEIAAPPAPADWRDAPQTPGTWRWRMEGDRSLAEYAPYAGAPIARLTCDPLGQATILWRNWPATGPMPLTVTTTGAKRMMTASPTAAGGVQVSLRPIDPLLDEMAFSRGRFMLEMPGAPTLYLPAWPELSRVIEDCRQKLDQRSATAGEAGPKP